MWSTIVVSTDQFHLVLKKFIWIWQLYSLTVLFSTSKVHLKIQSLLKIPKSFFAGLFSNSLIYTIYNWLVYTIPNFKGHVQWRGTKVDSTHNVKKIDQYEGPCIRGDPGLATASGNISLVYIFHLHGCRVCWEGDTCRRGTGHYSRQ